MARSDDDDTGGTGGNHKQHTEMSGTVMHGSGTIGGLSSGTSKRRKTPTTGKKLGHGYQPFYRLLKKLSEDKIAKEGEQYEFKYNDMIQILIKMKHLLQKEPPLVRCNLPCVIIGDIHGQFNDLHRVFDKFADLAKDRPGWLTQRYVFLGDYVDRGKQSLEVIVFVFLMKIKFPTSVFLLRGNHECKPINRVYGFCSELMERFGKEHGNNLFHMFNEAFTHLPLACLVGESVLCMHGGISPKLKSLDEIMKIPKPLVDPNSNELACDLLWADPMINLKGFKPNAIRGVSVHFGEDVLTSTMAALNIRLVVRGHQMMMNGFNFFAGQRLATVFTAASYYPDRANRGGILQVLADGRCAFHVISPWTGGGEKVFKGEHDDAVQYDVGYIVSVADEKLIVLIVALFSARIQYPLQMGLGNLKQRSGKGAQGIRAMFGC